MQPPSSDDGEDLADDTAADVEPLLAETRSNPTDPEQIWTKSPLYWLFAGKFTTFWSAKVSERRRVAGVRARPEMLDRALSDFESERAVLTKHIEATTRPCSIAESIHNNSQQNVSTNTTSGFPKRVAVRRRSIIFSSPALLFACISATMLITTIFAFLGLAASGLSSPVYHLQNITEGVQPLPLHSHNDYLRNTPLLDAISHGFTGVEADVWTLKPGLDELGIGHVNPSTSPEDYLSNQYLKPLEKIINHQNNKLGKLEGGRSRGVFMEDPSQTLVLLVDVKHNQNETVEILSKNLDPLRKLGYLSYSTEDDFVEGPITIVASGAADYHKLLQYPDIFLDAPMDIMYKYLREGTGVIYNRLNSYYASMDFASVAPWPMIGPLRLPQLMYIGELIGTAKDIGLKPRFYGLPDWPDTLREGVWQHLADYNISKLNVEDILTAITGDWRRGTRWEHLWPCCNLNGYVNAPYLKEE